MGSEIFLIQSENCYFSDLLLTLSILHYSIEQDVLKVHETILKLLKQLLGFLCQNIEKFEVKLILEL